MKFRWTIHDLQKSDEFILRGLVAERKSDLNPYAPLAVRLSEIYAKLDKHIDSEGQKIIAADPVLDVLVRLTEKVERANSLQHSRKDHTIPLEDWSELNQLATEARAIIREKKQC